MKRLNNKLGYVLTFVLASFLFTSCGSDEVGCYNSVRDEFPNAIEIKQPIGEKWRFIIMVEDSSIYFAKTINLTNTNVTHKELLFK